MEYEVLGVHKLDDDTRVARVRMFVGDEAIDEDLEYPAPITTDQQIDNAARLRMAEIKKKVSAKDSKLTVGDGDQIVNKEFTRTKRGY